MCVSVYIPVKFTSTGVLDLPTRFRGVSLLLHITTCNENVQIVEECDKIKSGQDTDVASVAFGQIPQFIAKTL